MHFRHSLKSMLISSVVNHVLSDKVVSVFNLSWITTSASSTGTLVNKAVTSKDRNSSSFSTCRPLISEAKSFELLTWCAFFLTSGDKILARYFAHSKVLDPIELTIGLKGMLLLFYAASGGHKNEAAGHTWGTVSYVVQPRSLPVSSFLSGCW